MAISVKPLGAGQEVGRSCVIVRIKDVKIMFDCGVHMAFNDSRKFPDFRKILDMDKNSGTNTNLSTSEGTFTESNTSTNNIYHNLDDKIEYTKHIDLIVITHFHLDHCGALPYFTEICGYNGPIITSQPTKAILPITLEDFRKIISDYRGEKSILLPDQIFKCMNKIQTVEIGQVTLINKRIKVTAYYAGHVLGAGMYKVEVDGYSVVYTGDYNTSSDRHLSGAYIPKIYPDIFITESTYGDTIRDTKRVREREFLKQIQSTLDRGGKVLIPIFALGRAQELCILLDTHWRRTKSEVPIYFAGPLAEKANFYYKIFTNWTNSKVKNIFMDRNVFDFHFVKHGDKSVTKSNQPMVIFATPGMLHGGLSLAIFKEIAIDSRNTVIIPGYCTSGTVGNKILSGERLIEIDKQMIEVKCDVYYMSFSAHADAKGLLQLIKNAAPKNVVLVHGDSEVMKKFQSSVEMTLNINTTMPANYQEIPFYGFQLYHQIEMNIYLFQILNFLLEKNYNKNFNNCLKRFPIVNVSRNKNKLMLNYFNPLCKIKNTYGNPKIRNRIRIDITGIKNINLNEMFCTFIEKLHFRIFKILKDLESEYFIKFNLLKNEKLELEWNYDIRNIIHKANHRKGLIVSKYLENFVETLREINKNTSCK